MSKKNMNKKKNNKKIKEHFGPPEKTIWGWIKYIIGMIIYLLLFLVVIFTIFGLFFGSND